ncbi:MAG: glycosyltransferase family 2 protein [Pseudotabrizicola sp.]|uniref:glycosyltransferase family 2 protein n=1 Tax=Pseudotabrizicola sp. TaxID=2939647 RepID=UPI002718163B|nr:glycosyltransferase family 2 protein [Pseudotabrizicola sp.]MDO9637548.1 glycosyltransferase family 2 protein [Pseudotabrizicola sp.]
MIPFRTANGATFRCQIDPDWAPHANLNFYTAGQGQIAFHLSLRLLDGLAVINRQDHVGWHREEHIALTFPKRRFTVALSFDAHGVGVDLDGEGLGRFSRLPRFDRAARFLLRRGYPQLCQITLCAAEGAVPWETIETRDHSFDRLWDGLTPASGLVLTDRMELAERLPRGQTAPRHGVILPGSAGPVALSPATQAPTSVPNTFALPEGIAAVLVPGRIWLDTAPGATAELPVIDLTTGRACPPLRIDRAGLADRLLRQTRNGAIANDDIAALQAIEHTCHSGIWPDLDPQVQTALVTAAARFGLSGFLTTAIGATPAVPAPTAIPAPPLADLTADLSRLLATSPDRAALADWLDRALPATDSTDTEHLALTLCPSFCDHNAFDLLYDAICARGLPPVRASDDVGYVSLRLPFQLLEGDYDQVIHRMHLLASRHGGWLASTALGWIARAVAPPGALPLPDAQRHAIIAAFCALLSAQAKDPWGRTPCHGLMDGLLALLSQLPRLPPDLRATLEQTALSAYGLSPRFWSLLPSAADTNTLSAFAPGLLTAGRAFASLTDPAHSASSLSTLHALNVQGVASAALCLHPAADLRSSAPWHPDLHLRDLFRPGATDDPNFDVRSAIARSQPSTGRAPRPAPFEALERHTGQTAFDLITDWPTMAPPQRLARLEAVLADALALSGEAAAHVGLAVSLGLIRALRDDAGAVSRVLTALRQMVTTAQITPRALISPAATPGLQAVRADPTLGPLVNAALNLPASPTGPATPPPDAATALFNTVVVVMSCHPNLATRFPAMRLGWLADLSRLGIPYIVVVGGAGGSQVADVIPLTAPDDYEGLPQKTLAAITHVHQHFPGRRMLKVDDDCFLDVEEYFFSLSGLKADYYGRPLARARGQMDRSWHMGKSTTLRGRHDLDKSPEPSTYADGGSGYLLSPAAITALLANAATAEGQRLVQASFMEDKLVGDLLALSGIRVSGDDYRVHVLRRARAGGLPVPKWENTCLPFAGSGVKLAHLDGHDLQDLATRTAKTRRPATDKIWPTLIPARLGAQSHALDLISPAVRFDLARKAPVAVVACVRNEIAMLPHFLAHYRNLGVDSFLIADNGSDDGTLEHLAEQPDVALLAVDSDYSQSHYGVLWQQALLAQRTGLWSMVADADEFLTWTADATGSLPALLAGPDFTDYDAARIFMLDMYPQGPLSATDFTDQPPFTAAPFIDRAPFRTTALGRGPFSDAPTFTSATRHRLLPGSRPELFVAQKIALLRYQPWMRLSDGLHYVAETRLSPRALLFGHFKYTAAFRAKAVAEVARGQHFNNAEEYRKYLTLISEGRETIFDPALSVRWTDSPFVHSILSTGKPPAP